MPIPEFPGEENKTPFPVEKIHTINGKKYTIKAMSFWELTNLPDTVVGNVFQALPNKKEFGKADIVMALRGQVAQIMAHQIGCKPDDFKAISAETGLRIVSDWLEVNMTENFIKAMTDVIGAVMAIKQDFSK